MNKRHQMTLIETFPEGDTKTTTSTHDGSAAQAHANRVRRLREAGTEYMAGPGWVEITYYLGRGESAFVKRTRLEYTDVQGGAK